MALFGNLVAPLFPFHNKLLELCELRDVFEFVLVVAVVRYPSKMLQVFG
jgi:hypothetical protein